MVQTNSTTRRLALLVSPIVCAAGLIGLLTYTSARSPNEAGQSAPQQMKTSYSTDASTVHEHHLSRPVGCEKVLDIRYEYGHASTRVYQLLCEGKDGEKALFVRNKDTPNWYKISVVPTVQEQYENQKVK